MSHSSLKDLELRDNYSSDDSNILEELFSPCLGVSDSYFRSVGFLDSKMFGLLGSEFDRFSSGGGRARLLIGRTVSPEDYVAIRDGAMNPERFCDFSGVNELWEAFSSEGLKERGLLVLSWLVSKRVISVKFSIRPRGMHHDKFAYFRDRSGDEVIIHGTNNETEAANLPEFNYESLSVFKSWETETYAKHGEYKLAEFLKFWEGRSRISLCIDAPNPALEKLAYLSERERHNDKYIELFKELEEVYARTSKLPNLPVFWGEERYGLHKHQKEAINSFFDADNCGILALATGSGKTITSIHAATLLSREIAEYNNCDMLVVVSVPFQVLADQWVENLRIFDYEPITAYGSIANWLRAFTFITDLASFEPAARVHSVVVVNKTLRSPEFQGLINRFESSQVIYIGDECHRLGSVIEADKAPKADYKIGLSATPWARKEEKLKKTLQDYFGPVVANYGLEEAFEDDVLVPYRYLPVTVSLNDEEGEEYEKYTTEIKTLLAIKLDGGQIDEDRLNYLLNSRASVIGSAEEKFSSLPTVLNQVESVASLSHLLVYCGSGTTEDIDSATGKTRDIQRAQEISAERLGLQSGRITASESQRARRAILNAFQNGVLNAIFAIKVLDEGFDMPGIRSAILLASSRNERQFIQRRGRVLRKNKDKEQAYIWDFIVTGAGVMQPGFASELMHQELLRVIEFSRLALNWSELMPRIETLAIDAGLDMEAILDEVESNPYEEKE